MDVTGVAKLFESFARDECRGSSALYEGLSLQIARDGELLALAAQGRTPIPNLFLAAVHDVVLQSPAGELAGYYPSAGGTKAVDDRLAVVFRDFCLRNQAEILAIIKTRLVQTNEVRRCAYLAPAFGAAAKLARGRPLALIEIGTAAGLNLLWDQYSYDYGNGRRWGRSGTEVHIACECRGEMPPLPEAGMGIEARIGLDLNPIDAGDEEATRWLNALIWPEHHERRVMLGAALRVARGCRERLRLIGGDATVTLPGVLAGIPEGVVPCVFQTHSLNQFPAEARARFMEILERAGGRRTLLFLSRHDELTLDVREGQGHTRSVLAETDAHGRWFRWHDFSL